MTFPQVLTTAFEFPATVLKLLGIEVPEGLFPPNKEIIQKFDPKAIVIIMIDNFGLFEAVVYKPEALIRNMEVLALLDTNDP